MIVTLQDQGYSITIDSVGAELKSYIAPSGKNYIWNADPQFWARSSPLLFPIIGNLRDNKTTIYGKEYTISKHGFMRELDFSVEKMAENKASFSFTSTEEQLSVYPFPFTFTLTYELKGSSLDIGYFVKNRGEETMLFNFGAHPGFTCPLEEGENFTDYVIRFQEAECCDSPVYDFENNQFSFALAKRYFDNTTTLPLKHSLFDQDAVVVIEPKSSYVQIVNPNTEKGVQVDISDFAIAAFWSPIGKEAPFVCVEPWNGIAICNDEGNDFAQKRYVQKAATGETKEYHMGISLME